MTSCGGAFTSSIRLVSISRRRGWFLFEFEAVRTASRRDGPDAVRDGSKSTKRPPTACSPPDAIDATRTKISDAATHDAPRRDLAVRALEGGSSTTKQILIDQDLRGWKEVEYEARGRRPFDLLVWYHTVPYGTILLAPC